MELQVTRRQALATAGLIAASGAGVGTAAEADPRASRPSRPICVFTKPFNSLSYDELAECISETGADGLETPIRAGGNIEPSEVADELPKLVEALAARELEITILASDINDASDPMTEKLLRVAANSGIRYYRMKYLRYDLDQPVRQQLQSWKPRLRELATLNRELGVTALYQNHAGRDQLGAPLWDLPIVLDGIPSNEIGVAYDIRHATVEGGKSWPITFNRIRPHLAAVYVKDFKWIGKEVTNVPLGEGNVDASIVRSLARSGFAGPISLHEEYLDHRQASLVPQHLAAIKRDLGTLKRWLE